MKLLRTWITLAAGLALSAAVHAQAFPSKPIRVVVGFPAGGPLDQHARLLSDGSRRADQDQERDGRQPDLPSQMPSRQLRRKVRLASISLLIFRRSCREGICGS
eukprot:gene3813-4879_t